MGDIVIGSHVTPLSAEVIERSGKSRLAGVRCSMLDQATLTFGADPLLLRVATEAANSVRDEISTEMAASSTARVPRVDVGVVGSSDVWRQSPAVIEQCHKSYGTLCEEVSDEPRILHRSGALACLAYPSSTLSS